MACKTKKVAEDADPAVILSVLDEENVGCNLSSFIFHRSTTLTMSISTDNVAEGEGVAKRDLWKSALASLSKEHQQQFDGCEENMLEVLQKTQTATEAMKTQCEAKSWKVYRNKDGDEVKLRHMLEKLSCWIQAVINGADTVVQSEPTNYAALPWAVVKVLLTSGMAEVGLFSRITEGVEYVSHLIARYKFVEKLYLQEQGDTTLQLEKAIEKLYVAILTYLASARSFFAVNTKKRVARSIIDSIQGKFEALLADVSETEIDKWMKLAEMEFHANKSQDATRYQNTLMRALKDLNKPIIAFDQSLSRIEYRFHVEERRKFYRWMSEIEYRDHHADLSRDLLPGSGHWLISNPSFIDWAQSSVSSILWLHGIPGSGKTRLTSQVINLHHDIAMASTAFFYCARSTAEPERARPAEIMGALLRQLCSSSDQQIKEPVAREYGNRKEVADKDCSRISKLTVEDCKRLIIEITQASSATIIIDALDECEESSRHELMIALDDILRDSGQVVKIFISSRDDIDIKLHFDQPRNILIGVEDNKNDIDHFIEWKVKSMIKQRLLLDGDVTPTCESKIIESLSEGAQGMFRWVEMSLEALQRQRYRRDFEEQLGKLPSGLFELYDIIHEQMYDTGSHGRGVAVKVLRWLLGAQRLLSREELIVAVSERLYSSSQTENESDAEDEDDDNSLGHHVKNGDRNAVATSDNDILRLCRNFVVLDHDHTVFRLAHQSVREYLLAKPDFVHTEHHLLILESCLDVYLSEDISTSGVHTECVEIDIRPLCNNDTLKAYAEVYWPVHFKHVEHALPRNVQSKISYFKRCCYVQWASGIHAEFIKTQNDSRKFRNRFTCSIYDPLIKRLLLASSKAESQWSLACAFGLTSIVKDEAVCSKDLHQVWEVNCHVYNLLIVAAQEGSLELVSFLLQRGVNCAERGGPDELTAFETACLRGHYQIAKAIIDHGVNISSEEGFTALTIASARGHMQVVHLLLDYGVKPDANFPISKHRTWPRACSGLDSSPVAIIETSGPRVDIQSGCFPLREASRKGHTKTVRLLLNRGADVNNQIDCHSNALYRAALAGDLKTAKVLLYKGANIAAPGGYYGNALQAACMSYPTPPQQKHLVRKETIDLVRFLLDRGADVNLQGGEYGSALQTAIVRSGQHPELVQVLLDAGADIHSDDGHHGKAIFLATERGQKCIMQLLYDFGAKPVTLFPPIMRCGTHQMDRVSEFV